MLTSGCLHDEGEEEWPLKLHLGCGGIYLRGYVNINHVGELTRDRPDLVEQNATDVSNYYARLDGDMEHIPARRETVTDVLCDATWLIDEPGSVDKIVAIQVFEHIPPIDSVWTLDGWYGLLKHGGVLVMSVPDMLDALDMPIDQMQRQLRGTKDNPHKAWYTQETLMEMLEAVGFDVEVLPNFHFYPAIVVRAVKR